MAIKQACSASASASWRRPPPRARATADATPPPMPPADIVCMSMISGNTSETPASASGPSHPTNTASPALTRTWTAMTTTLGAANRSSVGTIGPSRRRRVRASASFVTRSAPSSCAASPPLGLLALQRHAGGRRAGDEPVLLIAHVALHQADVAPALDDSALRTQRGRPHGPQKIDLQLERREGLPLTEGAGIGHPHRGVGDVAEDPAVEGAHGIGMTLVGRELDRGRAGLDGHEGEPDQGGDRRGGGLAPQHHPAPLQHGGHRTLPPILGTPPARAGIQWIKSSHYKIS